MVNRRSLGEGLSLTPDKMAFIQGSAQPAVSPKPALVKPPEIAVAPETIESEERGEELPETPSSDEVETLNRSPTRRTRSRTRVEKDPKQDPIMLGMADLLIPLTTRLQPSTAVALKRAGLEQRLNGAKPATVQEIAEVAIARWLKDHDYL